LERWSDSLMHCNHFRKPETTAIAAIKAAIISNVDVQDAESFNKRMQDPSLSPSPRTAPRLTHQMMVCF